MKHHYLKSFVCILVVLTGCTDRIKFDSLNIEPLLTDIPKECNPINKLGKCVVEINTPCSFDKSKFLAKMLGSNGHDSKLRNGTLCVPDVDTAIICVYAKDGVKHVEMRTIKGKITSLRIWNKSRLLAEAEGIFGKDIQDGKYYFLSGTQKIYGDYLPVVERTSNYEDGCKEFVESEKLYIVDEKGSYYKLTQKKYVNYYDGYGTTLDNINYRKIEDAKYTIRSVRYEDEDGQQLSIRDMLFIEKQPYVLYKTSVIKDGKRTYFAMFDDGYGVFFNSQDPNFGGTLEHAVRWSIWTIRDEECCNIDALNDYKPYSPDYPYKVSIDSLGHVRFQYDGNINFPPTTMEYFQAPYHSWLEEGLRKRLEEERDVSLENYRRERARENLFESTNSRMVEIPCPECDGSGRIAQSGMGVMHGTLSCPRCMGRGTIKVDPYSPY